MDDNSSQVLHLFDLYWFRHQILRPQPPPPPPPLLPSDPLPTPRQLQSAQNPPPLLLRRHRRSLSDESAPAPAPSASLSIHPPRLSTILSGKQAPPDDLVPAAAPPAADVVTKSYAGERRRGGRARRSKKEEKSKSLTDLEFEELKGFIDLGFSFSDAEADPRLLDILPGLRRSKPPPKAAAPPPDAPDGTTVSRPYLSEAWEAKPEEELLKNWRFQATGGGADVKDQLRCWAHAVASTVVR